MDGIDGMDEGGQRVETWSYRVSHEDVMYNMPNLLLFESCKSYKFLSQEKKNSVVI